MLDRRIQQGAFFNFLIRAIVLTVDDFSVVIIKQITIDDK